MENKTQDSKREFFHKWDNTTDFEQGHTFNSYKDANKVWEYIASEISKAREETFTKEEWDLILYAVSGSANKDTGAYDEMCDKFDNEYGEPKNETVEAFDKLLDKVEQLRLSKLTTK